MKTLNLFQTYNAKLAQRLIDNELPEARGCVDPKDEIFDKPLKDIYNEQF